MAIIQNPVYIFLIVLTIILVVPMLLTRLRIPHIIGLIVAGIVVGPYGVHLLERDSSFSIFGQVGILYLMFLAGLEIDMLNMRRNFRRGLTFGVITFCLPLAVGLLTSRWLLGMNWLTALLLSSLYASHTLISYPIVSRFGISKYRTVVFVVVGTIFAVLASLIVLAVCVNIQDNGHFSWWVIVRLVGSLAIYLAVSIWLYPRLVRWFFRRHNDGVLQYVFIMALVMLAATICTAIGVEAVLGAFFAGIILNRFIPAASSLKNRIEFVGNAIFIPYFLIGVGMMINVGVIFSDWTTIYFATVMSVVACTTKWSAALLTQKVMRLGRLDRQIMFGLSNAHVAAALAAVMIGVQKEIFTPEVLNATILMILVSCTLAGVVTEEAASKIKLQMVSADAENGQSAESYKENFSNVKKRRRARILVALSNPLTVKSLMSLSLMARSKDNRNPIYGIHVRQDDSPTARANAENTIEIASKVAASVDVTFEPLDRFDLNPITGIVNAARERNVTDIVVGLHQRSTMMDSFLGTKVEQLLGLIHKMVIISRCLIPLNTISRIVVWVPAKAEYETGFRDWVSRLGNIARQISCRIIFLAHHDTIPYIRGVIVEQEVDIRNEFIEMPTWDDFLVQADHIHSNDLFVIIGARRNSLSYTSDMDDIPSFLGKYFTHHNIVIIYPEQWGAEPAKIVSFSAPIANSKAVTSGGVWRSLSRLVHHRTQRGSDDQEDW